MDEQNPRIDDLGAAYSAPSAMEESPDERTYELRAEIEQTREDMSETVNAIQERLRPSTLASNAADSVKQTALEKAREVADSDSVMYIRANPIPTAMVGIGVAGLAWLAVRGRNGRSYSRSYSRREVQPTNREWHTLASPTGLPDAPRATSGQENLSGYPDVGRRAQSQLQHTWNENPLLIGAASAVLGAIVGFAIPETEREHQLMGVTRDNVMDTVQETVREKVNQVQEAATNAVSTVQDAAKNAVGLTPTPDSNTQGS